jgi:hypothetical protein
MLHALFVVARMKMWLLLGNAMSPLLLYGNLGCFIAQRPGLSSQSLIYQVTTVSSCHTDTIAMAFSLLDGSGKVKNDDLTYTSYAAYIWLFGLDASQ